ncbi:MAG: SPOR domain-containing protein [Epsilonproteobacteria bacterium]|nr:SPOR domain-containing protein [Campylobacterota bacterium]
MEDKLEKLKKKSDLSDIILEKDTSSNEKIKKLLLGIASLVLLFLIILIAMKMFNNNDVSPSENLASVDEAIEQKVENIIEPSRDLIEEQNDALFKEEPIIDETSETDLKFEEMVRKLKQQDAQEAEPENTKIEDNDLTTVLDETKETIIDTEDNVIDKIKEFKTTLPKTPVVAPVKEVTKVVTPKPEVKEVVISKKPVITPTPSPISSMSGYFIQVGATSKSFPDKRFLTKIKNNGFDYIVHKVNIKGQDIKKVLVGPYGTREQARSDLSNVQSKINPSAYIYRIK